MLSIKNTLSKWSALLTAPKQTSLSLHPSEVDVVSSTLLYESISILLGVLLSTSVIGVLPSPSTENIVQTDSDSGRVGGRLPGAFQGSCKP